MIFVAVVLASIVLAEWLTRLRGRQVAAMATGLGLVPGSV
jgi:hypothetical protein